MIRMREVIIKCDICGDPIRPETRTARKFEVDGKLLDCCGLKCFLDFWAEHYDTWDELHISFSGSQAADRQFAILKKESK